MRRHLTTLILTGLMGSMVLVGNAEACHRSEVRVCGAVGIVRFPGRHLACKL